MPRMARKRSSTKVYHIMMRGNAKQKIFLDDKDYQKFMKELHKTKEKFNYHLYAYCLMPNHVHLVIYDKEEKLSKILQSINVSYVSYWNKKYERVGHLFQNRFLSKSVETKAYLKTLCRYIHQNPSKSRLQDMEKYQWSSYQEYIDPRKKIETKIVETKQLLQLFNIEENEAIKNFVEFHKINLEKDTISELVQYELGEKLNDEQVHQYILEHLKLQNIQELLSCNLEKRNQYLSELQELQGVSKSQIARVLGISTSIVLRAKRKEKSDNQNKIRET